MSSFKQLWEKIIDLGKILDLDLDTDLIIIIKIFYF